MSKAKEIVDGLTNLVKHKVGVSNEKIESEADRRLKICYECPYGRNKIRCTACGCFLAAKSRSPHSTCPKDKW